MALWKFWNTWNNNLTAILGYAPEHTASHSLLNPSFLCHFHFRKKMCRYLPQNISKYDHENQTCWVDIEEVIFMCQWAWVFFLGYFMFLLGPDFSCLFYRPKVQEIVVYSLLFTEAGQTLLGIIATGSDNVDLALVQQGR